MSSRHSRLGLRARSIPTQGSRGRVGAARPGPAEQVGALDGLTRLGTRASFDESLLLETMRAQRFGEPFTLALLEVDDFDAFARRVGSRRGDAVLVDVAAALRAGRAVDRAFRVGGDEFAMIMPRTRVDDATPAVERFRETVRRGLGEITISMGLAEFDPADTSTDAGALRDRADLALYEAKSRGPGEVVSFDQYAGSAPANRSAAMIAAVRDLLASRRMGAAFQPIWNLSTRRVFGYAALARPADEFGLDGPRAAFAGAARLGRVTELDALCREAVLARVGDLPPGVLLFWNIAHEVLAQDDGASRRIQQEVEAAGLLPEQVVIVLTAHAGELLDLDRVDELRELGFEIALDDVGSGDSGLGILGAVQPGYVKVDRDVLTSARDDGSGRAVLAAIVAYAAESGAVVIAEGIDTEEILQLVGAAGTANKWAQFVGGQGYLLGRPEAQIPAADTARNAWPIPQLVMWRPELVPAALESACWCNFDGGLSP